MRIVNSILWPLLFGLAAVPHAAAQSLSAPRVHRSQLGPEYRRFVSALGDRLETRGKERLTLGGNLTQPGRKAAAQSVAIVVDIAGMLRMDAAAETASTVAFDGKQLNATSTTTQSDQDLVDSVVFDSMEQFIVGRLQGFGIRRIASRARMTAPQNVTAATPFCDVYQVLDGSQTSWKAAAQSKMYCFDSDTHLLRSVFYTVGAASGRKSVETRFSDWHAIESAGQMVPWKIERIENGVSVFSLTVTSAKLSPAAADGLFVKP
jgi:hypothetical protein